MSKPLEQILRDLALKPIQRAISIDRTAVDEENRTVSLAFASDKPVEHWFGNLSLSMKPGAMRTVRLDSGAPLLMDHNSRDQVGVVEEYSIDEKGGMARAIVRFDTDQRSTDIFNSVKNGIRRNVSVGFMVNSLELVEEKKNELPTYRCDDWEPMEISIVSMPADTSVGVGRSADFEGADPKDKVSAQNRATSNTPELNNMPDKENETPETPAATVAVRDAELVIADEIREWGKDLKCDELATEYLRDTKLNERAVAVKDFMAYAKSKQLPAIIVPPEPAAATAARQGGIQLATSVYRGGPLKAFKGDKAEETAYRCGMHLAALLLRDENAIAWCRERGISLNRAQTGGDNTKGGYTVLPEFDQTIFQLIIQYGIARPNADSVPMNGDTKLVTRRTGGLTAYPVGPSQRGTYSNTTDDQFELVARKWMVLAKYEDELGEDSYINWADRLANEAGIALAYAEDNSTFNGDGTSTYHGIVGLIPKLLAATAGLATAAGATLASVTAANMTSLVGLLPQYARKSGNVKFFCSHGVWANVLERIAIAAGGNAYADIKGELTPVFFGRPVEIVEVMSAAPATGEIAVVYGNMAQSTTFGDRRGITVKMTDSNDTDFESDLHAVKVTERFDVNNHDVGDTSVAGPMVALKLA